MVEKTNVRVLTLVSNRMKRAQGIIMVIFICIGCTEDKSPLPPTNNFVGSWWGERSGDGVNIEFD